MKGAFCLSVICAIVTATYAFQLVSRRSMCNHRLCRHQSLSPETVVVYLAKSERASSSNMDIILASDDVEALKREAAKLRAEANEIRQGIEEKKAQKVQRETERIDQLIDEVLIAVKVDNQTQMLHTEEQVMILMQEKRLSADHVNKIFDRICELSNRQQSIDNCSPLISLLLDAACMLDCMERSENPNKRWNHRVERDLRKKLFALGWGINIDDVRREEREGPRSITGEKDLN